MNRLRALIVADEPENRSFVTITNLKQQIEEKGNKVDLIAFSKDNDFLNQERITSKGERLEQLTRLIKEKNYTMVVISLTSKYLVQLFQENKNIVKILRDISPKTAIFVFGASTIFRDIKPAKDVFLYSRSGVAKLTQKVNKDIISYIVSHQGIES